MQCPLRANHPGWAITKQMEGSVHRVRGFESHTNTPLHPVLLSWLFPVGKRPFGSHGWDKADPPPAELTQALLHAHFSVADQTPSSLRGLSLELSITSSGH